MGPPLGEGVWEDPPESCPLRTLEGEEVTSALRVRVEGGGGVGGGGGGGGGGGWRRGEAGTNKARGLPPHLVPFLQGLLGSSELCAFVSGLVSSVSAPL